MNVLDSHAPGMDQAQMFVHKSWPIEGLKCNFNFVRKSGNLFGVRVQKHTQLRDGQLSSYFQSPYFLLLSTKKKRPVFHRAGRNRSSTIYVLLKITFMVKIKAKMSKN